MFYCFPVKIYGIAMVQLTALLKIGSLHFYFFCANSTAQPTILRNYNVIITYVIWRLEWNTLRNFPNVDIL